MHLAKFIMSLTLTNAESIDEGEGKRWVFELDPVRFVILVLFVLLIFFEVWIFLVFFLHFQIYLQYTALVKKSRSQVWPFGFFSESQNEILRVNKT